MDIKEFEQIFNNELLKNNIKLNTFDYEKMFYYMNSIIEYNKKINLTSITDRKMFLVKHLIDSLTINRFVASGKNLIDIGTGAGFPGIPLKIANPNLEVTLIDSINKKLEVIRSIINNMYIGKIDIIHSRAEDLGINKEYREKFDFATTRAVAKLNIIVEYMLPFIKIGGKAICMKGPNITEELKEAEKAIKILGGKIEKVEKINLDNEYERSIVIILKEKTTPIQYPRRNGRPLKEPII
ncbi:MAG: 16S rRNA (guanine(527)-N(7))-methyltransferase RsmG [Clostridia bacterium]|nr:16S rRNA (guanine(527)-N(7))-methyltransferase RsmG [Clostridia bacterium]